MPVFHIVECIKYIIVFALSALHLIFYVLYQVKIDWEFFNNCLHIVVLLGCIHINCFLF